MKKSDIAMIILVASVSIGISMFVVNSLPFLKAPEKAAQVDTIEKFDSTITDPEPDIFNASAINPTVDINIGENNAAKED